MKYLRLFESLDEEDIHNICKIYHIRNYTINQDATIDVDYNADLSYNNLNILPLKFRSVGGYFACAGNGLKSLEGCPKITGSFNCSENQLTSLKGCPEIVEGDFICSYNNLTTFEHFPKHIGGDFNCYNNPIYQIWELFGDVSKIELFNDMDIIQDGVVLLDRLNFFLEEIESGQPTIKSIFRYKYI